MVTVYGYICTVHLVIWDRRTYASIYTKEGVIFVKQWKELYKVTNSFRF